MVPIVKRNLTPDDHTNKQDVDSYLLVDNNGQPKKVYIKRNVPIKVINHKDPKSKTLDYSDDRLEEGSVNNFQTVGYQPRKDFIKPTLGKHSKRNFLLGGESSLICCLSSKSQRQREYNSTQSNGRKESSNSRCLLQ